MTKLSALLRLALAPISGVCSFVHTAWMVTHAVVRPCRQRAEDVDHDMTRTEQQSVVASTRASMTFVVDSFRSSIRRRWLLGR